MSEEDYRKVFSVFSDLALGLVILLLVLIFFFGCSRRPVRIMVPEARQGYGYYVVDDSVTILVLKDSTAYRTAIDDLCKDICTVADSGEVFVLTKLSKGNKK